MNTAFFPRFCPKSVGVCSSYLFLCLCFALLIAGCSTTRKSVRSIGSTRALTKKEFIYHYGLQHSPLAVDSKGKVTLFSQGNSTSTAMRWTYVQEQGFALSLRPLGLIELARLVVTPQQIIVLDRTQRQAFVSDEPEQLTQLFEDITGYTPHVLTALVAHEPFSFGATGVEALQKMKMQVSDGLYRFEENKHGVHLVHLFDAQLHLVESRVLATQKELLKVRYQDFTSDLSDAGTRAYPTSIDVSIGWNDMPLALHLALDHPTFEQQAKIDGSIPRGYKRLGIFRIIKRIRTLLP